MTPEDREIMVRHLADQLLTEPMSVESLAHYFVVNWRTMKSILSAMEGVEKISTLYRVPVKKMPPRYLQEKKLLFDPCKFLHNPAIDIFKND